MDANTANPNICPVQGYTYSNVYYSEMKAPTTISQDEDDVHVCMGQEAIRVEATIITESRQKKES